MNAIRPLLRNPAVKNYVRRSYHETKDFRHPTMDDLPLPNGSWKAHHDAMNTKYNMHLLFGVAFAVVTFVTAKTSGLVYLNYYPPELPE